MCNSPTCQICHPTPHKHKGYILELRSLRGIKIVAEISARVKLSKSLAVRAHIAKWLIALAGLVLGCSVEVSFSEENKEAPG
jgi:hypothetical protein